MFTNRGHWFWPSARAVAQYQRKHGGLPREWLSVNRSTGGDPAIIGSQCALTTNPDAWLRLPILVASGFNPKTGRWQQVLCLRSGQEDALDLL